MDPTVTTNTPNTELHVKSTSQSHLEQDASADATTIQLETSDNVPTGNDLTVTPAFPNFPTDEEVVITPETVVQLRNPMEPSEQENNSTLSPSNTFTSPQRNSQLLDELKYLLKPTNSLATSVSMIQASQEADASIKRRTLQFDDDVLNNTHRLLMNDLTPNEIKSLDAAERRSFSARSRRSSSLKPISIRSRAPSLQPTSNSRSHSQSPTAILIDQPGPRTFADHVPGLIWAFLAAYSFSIILFLTDICRIDLIFGFFLQMVVQTIAFGVYAFYKGYNLLGPADHRWAMICRALLIGIGALTSFLAYYYITLPDLSAVRQTQVMLSIVLSIFLLRERVTIARIVACIGTFLAITILIRPTTFGSLLSTKSNITNSKSSWTPYSSSWNYVIGISLVLCTAITHSIASTLNRMYFSTQHLHNTVLCFWSALLALILASSLLYVTHFALPNARSFPHDWRLFVAFVLALASIFVFIANQKAVKRERASIVTLIYSTDILLALILQNLFTQIKSDAFVLLGCLLIFISVLIICLEVLKAEQMKKALVNKTAEIINATEQETNHFPRPSILKRTSEPLAT